MKFLSERVIYYKEKQIDSIYLQQEYVIDYIPIDQKLYSHLLKTGLGVCLLANEGEWK